jgi:peptidyl-tRNA hydrolase, PTH1 family
MNPSILFGLGNPGAKYSGNRHNIGQILVDYIAGTKAGFKDCGSYTATKIRIGQESILLCKAKSLYMNDSGRVAKAIVSSQNISPKELLVAYDDFAISFGSIRLRKGGTDGGHNGMFDIIEQLGTIEVPRLRLGIGPIPEYVSSVDFVLSDFEKEEQKKLAAVFSQSKELLFKIFNEGFDKAMSIYNRIERTDNVNLINSKENQ